MRAASFALLVVSFLLVAGCAEQGETPTPTTSTTPTTPTGSSPAGGDCAGAVEHAEPKLARLETTMGSIVVRLATDGAPDTVQNFVDRAERDEYDGVLFHRVIGPQRAPPAGFMIQTGDPLTKDPDTPPERYGTGGENPIPDEFHPDLQHDAAGVLSMANRGPNTGTSQFFITLTPTRHLDDKHAVFGHVVEGMDVVRAIGNVSTDENDRPREDVRITDIVIETGAVERGVAVRPVLAEKTVGAGREAQFLLLGTNTGSVQDRVRFAADAPDGWTVAFDVECATVIPGAGRVSVLGVTPVAGFTGAETVTVRVTGSDGAEASTEVRLTVGEVGDEVARGDRVRANYVGVLENGRLFDTSLASVAHDEGLPKSSSFCVRDTPAPCNGNGQAVRAYSPFEFVPGSGVIEGFSRLAEGARIGETPAGRIAPEDAYGPAGGGHALSGKTLLFELELVAKLS